MSVYILLSSATAQTIANWTFNNTLVPTTGTNNTASNAALSAAVPSGEFNGGTLYFGQNGWPTGMTIDPNMYLEFSVTPNAGQQLHLQTIELVLRRSNLGTPSGGGPRAWVLRSGLDGFTSNIGSGPIAISNSTFTIPLGSEFLFLSHTVTFRLYGYDTHVNPGSLSRFVFDNIRITGLVLLPLEMAVSGKVSEAGPVIEWNVSHATPAEFMLERSENGDNFEKILTIQNNDQHLYSVTDKNAPNISRLFYRVKAMQQDGDIIYSDIVTLYQKAAEKLTVGGISGTGQDLRFQVNATKPGPAKVMITLFDGRILYQQQIHLTKGHQSLAIQTGNIHAGSAVLSLLTADGITSRQFVR